MPSQQAVKEVGIKKERGRREGASSGSGVFLRRGAYGWKLTVAGHQAAEIEGVQEGPLPVL